MEKIYGQMISVHTPEVRRKVLEDAKKCKMEIVQSVNPNYIQIHGTMNQFKAFDLYAEIRLLLGE